MTTAFCVSAHHTNQAGLQCWVAIGSRCILDPLAATDTSEVAWLVEGGGSQTAGGAQTPLRLHQQLR